MTRSGASKWSHQVAQYSYLVLVLQQLCELLVYRMPWVFWLAKLLPLLAFLPGILRDNLRSYIWLCFVSLLYFTALVVNAFGDGGSPLTLIGLAAVVVLFCAAMMYVRWRARELKLEAKERS